MFNLSQRHIVRSAVTAAFLAPLLLGATAKADRAAGDACAAGLTADGKAIYAATLPNLTPSADLRAIVTSATRSLVIGGTVPRANAEPAAEAAGKCLQLARS